MEKTEKRICLYGSLFITLMLSAPKLLALRENGIIAQFWRFNLAEWILQAIFTFIFCCVFLYLNLSPAKSFSVYRIQKRWAVYLIYNMLLAYLFVGVGILSEFLLFLGTQPNKIYLGGYQFRFGVSGLLIAILVKIVLLMRKAQQTEKENQALKSAYMSAELELLKEQLNPHFFFNSLSSLSGVVRENPTLAQHYIKHLSKVFRYALVKSEGSMVTVGEELDMLTSYAELLSMRFEQAFKLSVSIDNAYLTRHIPHLSLQPLLENAAKHNSATLDKPLIVEIFMEGNKLVVRNNLQKIKRPEYSTGLGLANLTERYRILMHGPVDISKTADYFTVKLPLVL